MSFYGQILGLAEEVTWGTPVARTAFKRIYPGSFLKHEIPRNPRTHLGERDPVGMFDQPEFCQGKIITPWTYTGAELLLKHAFGEETKTGAGPYVRTYKSSQRPFSRAASPLVGLTAEMFADIPHTGFESIIGEGLRVTSWGAEIRANEEVKLDVDVVGQRCDLGAKSVAFTPEEDLDADEVLPSQLVLTIDGASNQCIGAFTFRIESNLRTDKGCLGQATIVAPLPAEGKRVVTGSIEMDWTEFAGQADDSKTVFDAFMAKTVAKLEATMTGVGNNLGVLTFENVLFTGETPTPAEGGFLPTTIPFTALHDATKSVCQYVATSDTA